METRPKFIHLGCLASESRNNTSESGCFKFAHPYKF